MVQPIWNTPVGSVGAYASLITMQTQLSALAVLPAISITYTLLSGTLPTGLTISTSGLISGIPELVTQDTTYTFVVRATDNLGEIRDRTFSITISGVVNPRLTTPTGSILTTIDSIWIELPIDYENPVSSNKVSIRVVQGQLPPGLEINETGLIRGYPKPPTLSVNVGSVSTSAVSITSNVISCLSTNGFAINRPIVFSGTVFGGLTSGQTYYVRTVINATSFTVSGSAGGPELPLTDGAGFMNVVLPNITVGQPTVQSYTFAIKLESDFGSDLETYSITVINQNAPVSSGGPGLPANSRIPTIYNTRPPAYNITQDPLYGYYVLPDNSGGYTYDPDQDAYIGKISSDNEFSFKMIGYDFDGDLLNYSFANLPLGLVGDEVTGWISGNPIISNNNISEFSFSVAAYKASNVSRISPFVKFSFIITNDIIGDITWITTANLGVIENGTVSSLSIRAESDVTLQYRLTSGQLPPNLTLLSNGELTGTVAYQPTNTISASNTTDQFSFTIEAFSPNYPVVKTSREFIVNVVQEYTQPTDTLYIKCTPSIADRNLLKTLLENNDLIPDEVLYRPEDVNFGKATNVIYAHAYGIYANDLDAYIAAVTKNHYWRNITLGELKTAVAKNEQGEVIYEVVYSTVIDNLINPQGVSVSKEIFWPRFINLNLGPWYTSVDDIYTSYVNNPNETNTYNTSLTPGYARLLYPNSLPNMREQVGDVLGQEFNFRLYPKWMTSQQSDGSTLGFTPAWVIAYCKPGLAETVKNNIENNWKDMLGDNIRLNQINFKIDRFTVDKSATYNYDTLLDPASWTSLPSATPFPVPKDLYDFHVLYPRKTILPDDTQY
jgi:hypothetical protein